MMPVSCCAVDCTNRFTKESGVVFCVSTRSRKGEEMVSCDFSQ